MKILLSLPSPTVPFRNRSAPRSPVIHLIPIKSDVEQEQKMNKKSSHPFDTKTNDTGIQPNRTSKMFEKKNICTYKKIT